MKQLLTAQEILDLEEEHQIILMVIHEDFRPTWLEKRQWENPEYQKLAHRCQEILDILKADKKEKDRIARRQYVKTLHELGLTVAEVEHPYSPAALRASIKREIAAEAKANQF
jgi:hypothetical protein